MHPTFEQEEAWDEAAYAVEGIMSIVQSDMRTNTAESEMKQLVQTIQDKDSQLQNLNKQLDIPGGTYSLPISIVDKILKQFEASNDGGSGGVSEQIEILKNYAGTNQGLVAQNFLKALNGKPLPPLKEPLMLPAPRLPLVGNSTANTSGSTQLFPTTANETTISTTPTATTSGPDPLFVSEDDNLKLMASQLVDGTTELLDYTAGMTEFGSLEATRPCQTDNVRFARFIVNAGTSDFPHYTMVKGSDLCPGGAETLSNIPGKDTVFNYKDRKASMKTNANYMKKYGPCIITSRSEGYAPRSGAKPCCSDAYMRVEYVDANAPVDWLSRTEYTVLAQPMRGSGQCAANTIPPGLDLRLQHPPQ
ncbi:hypothetical protein EJ02DRAFT_513090 [Clathrospora elynae]|uniref:Uncharacterized protein n=1 Tax=Clathrospora elynae TaxID=706981 RepID=A0A6A5SLE6_9PLEO|nr:hypothetical protein EJ02DRAFT_513090 [Clathrospora elynae]